jgi:hypothetical protein
MKPPRVRENQADDVTIVDIAARASVSANTVSRS